MKKPFNEEPDNEDIRAKIMGLGGRAGRKSYYPQLQAHIDEIEQNRISIQKKSDDLLNTLKHLDQANANLTRVNEKLQSMVKTMHTLSTCSGLKKFGVLLLEEFAKSMKAADGCIYLIEKDGLRLIHSLIHDKHPEYMVFPFKKGTVLHGVLESGGPVLIKDIACDLDIESGIITTEGDCSVMVFPIPDDSGTVAGVMAVYSDLSRPFVEHDRELGAILASFSSETLRAIRANETLRENEAILKRAQQIAQMGHWIWNPENDGLMMSDSMCSITGISFMDQPGTMKSAIEKIVHPDDRKKFEHVTDYFLKSKPAHPFEYRIIKPGGEIRWLESTAPDTERFDETGRPVSLLGVVCDITERKTAQEQLAQRYKMDAIDHLAGGIAHDFNNMLSGILGAAELLAMSVEEENDQAQTLTRLIIESAERASELTNRLLAFSRKTVMEFRSTDIHSALKSAIDLLERSIDKKIRIQTSFGASKGVVSGDITQLQNVFINLGVNSSHAMPDGGRLEFMTENAVLDSESVRLMPFGVNPGEFVEIRVSDSGSGILPEHLDSIFEPFFTTKTEGKGTGLGLSAVYGTVRQHGGTLRVESRVGLGTVFSIFLPVSEIGEYPDVPDLKLVKGSGRIMLVDDEELIRSTVSLFLETMGYNVVMAENGLEAVRLYQKEYMNIDLVILDMIMPEMNGKECLKAMKKINPDVRVVIASGCTPERDHEEIKAAGILEMIRKPYRSATLSRVLADALSCGLKR